MVQTPFCWVEGCFTCQASKMGVIGVLPGSVQWPPYNRPLANVYRGRQRCCPFTVYSAFVGLHHA